MDTYFFENRDFFANRIQELEILSKSSRAVESLETSAEVPDTAVCVRIRPLTEEEIGWDHIQGVLRDSHGAANIYEPRRRINGKPDLRVSTSISRSISSKLRLEFSNIN
jgi:kinesin family protein 2/24